MTRWALVADLNRCVGCQTCTAACKHANSTAPGIQWRKVLDVEAGEYPDVRRAFVPVGCMHCDDPPCLDVCPSTATRKRADGIVTIDYDLCIGCAYCAVACPFQARYRIDKPAAAFGARVMRHESAREDLSRIGVAQKCTFCIDRIDNGLAAGLEPGVAPDATPACVASCIADALHFGDLENPHSNVSKLLADHQHFRMHEALGTGPGIHYVWAPADSTEPQAKPNGFDPESTIMDAGDAPGVSPVLQQSWDWRAAANFMAGGTGSGLFLLSALAALGGVHAPHLSLLGLFLVVVGLGCVWLEIGRPWRFLNVFLHPKRSWMTREAMAATGLLVLGFPSLVMASPALAAAAALCAGAFLFSQARILGNAKGIPAWREASLVPLLVSTGLCEGAGILAAGLVLVGALPDLAWSVQLLLLALVLARYLAWRSYRAALRKKGAPTGTVRALDGMTPGFVLIGHALPAALVSVGAIAIPLQPFFLSTAGLLVLVTGWLFKFVLIVRAAFNQGYALERMPARGGGTSVPGIKPGWILS